MSSQGPVGIVDKADPPFCTGPTGGTPLSTSDSRFNKVSIRDASDWLAYKKQSLIYGEDKTKIHQNQWAEHGNDYRIQYLLGKYKVGATGCTGCSSNVFVSDGPY